MLIVFIISLLAWVPLWLFYWYGFSDLERRMVAAHQRSRASQAHVVRAPLVAEEAMKQAFEPKRKWYSIHPVWVGMLVLTGLTMAAYVQYLH